VKAACVGDVLGSYDSAEILCLYQRTVARRLKRLPEGKVEVDAITVKVVVDATTPLNYQPWVFDRGSLLFDLPDHPGAKFCGEADIVRYPDDTTDSVEPA
jgi:hypothetical protein